MRKRVVVAHVAVVALVLLLLEVPLAITFARRERDALVATAQRDAISLASLSEEVIEHPAEHDVGALIRRFGGDIDGTAVLVDANGTVVGGEVPEGMSSDASLRLALDAARQGATVSSRAGGDAYAAAPVGTAGERHGAVLVTRAGDATESRIHELWVALLVIDVFVLGVAAFVGDRLARWATAPLQRLDDRAAALGRGDLSVRADVAGGPPEVSDLAKTFDDMAARLEELVAGQQRFVADASHQLRSPLTALRLRLDSIDLEDRAAAAADIDAAIDESIRLSRVIDGLLALARSQGARPERSRIDASAVVESRVAAWSALADERGVSLHQERPDASVMVDMVDGHLDQIIDNLVDNAIDASPEGGSVVVRLLDRADSVEVHVIDEGTGMESDERQHAFEPFWKGHGGGGASVGLGLAIVDQLARVNGAVARLDPASSGGIDAVLVIPRARMTPA